MLPFTIMSFNDVVFTVTVNPVTAMNLEIQSSPGIVDSDGDGVADNNDPFQMI